MSAVSAAVSLGRVNTEFLKKKLFRRGKYYNSILKNHIKVLFFLQDIQF
jgi:hypothetical protein